MKLRGLWVPLALGVLILALTVVQTLETTKQASVHPSLPPGSFVSARPDGCKALALLLRKNGFEAKKWGLSFLQLRSQRGAMIVVDPGDVFSQEEADVASDEWAVLEQWVAAGNVALVASRYGRGLQVVSNDDPTTATGEVDGVQLRLEGISDGFEGAPDREVVLRDSKGTAVLLRRTIGEGTLYSLSDSSLLTNEKVGLAENAALINLLNHPANVVYFDEFHLGNPSATSPLDVMPAPMRTAFWILVVLGVLAVLKAGSRFGGVLSEPPPLPLRSGAELATALGGLMLRADAGGLAASQMADRFRSQYGLAGGAPLSKSLEGLGIRDPALAKRLREQEIAVQAVRPRQSDLVAFGKTLRECSDAIAKARRGQPSILPNKP